MFGSVLHIMDKNPTDFGENQKSLISTETNLRECLLCVGSRGSFLVPSSATCTYHRELLLKACTLDHLWRLGCTLSWASYRTPMTALPWHQDRFHALSSQPLFSRQAHGPASSQLPQLGFWVSAMFKSSPVKILDTTLAILSSQSLTPSLANPLSHIPHPVSASPYLKQVCCPSSGSP